MLQLSSPRWATLKAHFGNAAEDHAEIAAVTKLIRRWTDAVGSYAEEYEYDPLHESFLHQNTILDVAYAVVPHLVPQLPRLDPDRRMEVLDDIARVDEVRLTPRSEVEKRVAAMATLPDELREQFIKDTRDRNPELADDLAPEYLVAIDRAKQLAGEAWNKNLSMPMGPHRWRRHVQFLRQSELSDADIRFGVQTLAHKPDGGDALVHLGLDDARRGLVEVADAAWLRRTGIASSKGALVLKALWAIASIERHVSISKMLGQVWRLDHWWR